MIVVSDTGPVNYLVLIGRIELLPTLFGEVIVPTAVSFELLDDGAPILVQEWARRPPGWLLLKDPQEASSIAGLGRGEIAAMSLAKEIGAPLLCDDGPARATARRMGLAVSGTLGVLQLAHARSLLDIDDALAALARTNFRHVAGLFASVAQRAEAMRPEFSSRPDAPFEA